MAKARNTISATRLLFLDKNTLVVGGGDVVDGEEMLYVFDLTRHEGAHQGFGSQSLVQVGG